MPRETRSEFGVLAVSDDPDADWVAALTRRAEFAVDPVAPDEALRAAAEGSYDGVVTAARFADTATSGFDLLERLTDRAPRLPVALVAAGRAESPQVDADARRAINGGAVAYIDSAEQADPYGTLADRLRSAATTTLRDAQSDGGAVDTLAVRPPTPGNGWTNCGCTKRSSRRSTKRSTSSTTRSGSSTSTTGTPR